MAERIVPTNNLLSDRKRRLIGILMFAQHQDQDAAIDEHGRPQRSAIGCRSQNVERQM